MTDHHDPIDDWLGTDVELLPPHPGAFQRIRRRAHRRRVTRTALTAAAAAVVIAAGVTLPQLSGLLPGRGQPVEVRQPTPSSGSHSPGRTSPSPSRSASPAASKPAALSGPALGATNAPPAAGFRPTSVTFVGPSTGAVLGQAPCGPRWCTSMAATTSYGGSWWRMGAPRAGSPNGGSGVSQVRFLDLRNGWVYGPELWATHDGGAHWKKISILSGRVIDLAAVGNRSFAVVGLGCTGTGADYAANCGSDALFTALATSDTWRLIPGGGGTGEVPGGLQLDSAHGYVLEGRSLLAGPVTGRNWHLVGNAAATEPPCLSGSANLPPGPALIAPSGGSLYLACDAGPAASTQARPGPLTLYRTGDTGRTWQALGAIAARGAPASLAVAPGSGMLVLATSRGIYYSADGRRWKQASLTRPPATGFSFIGMTTTYRGVAVPANSQLRVMFITQDGGLTWRRSVIP